MAEFLVNLIVFVAALVAVYFGSKIPQDKKKKFVTLADTIKMVAQDVVIAVEQISGSENLTSKQKKEKAFSMAVDILKNHGIDISKRDATLLDAAIEASVFLLDKQFGKQNS